jgi:asparagine synthase (glutamine-hydrolysing)
MGYLEKLDTLLEESVKSCVEPLHKFGLLYSGGLDSSLLAKICVDLGKKPALFSVYMVGSNDEKHIKNTTPFFNLPWKEQNVSAEDVKKYVPQVLASAKIKNLQDLSIGVSIYAALNAVSKDKIKSAVIGQGADELFGGYHRYLRVPQDKLDAVLRTDVESINIERDRSIANACGVELLTPFLNQNFVDYALCVPPELKIKNGVRKYILRELARKRGLPEEICSREKKAIQYSTGINKAVKRIVKTMVFKPT